MKHYAIDLELRQEAERRRIAEFLHDEISQSLTALRLAASLLQPGLPSEHADELAEILHHCDRAIAQTRQLMADVSPVVLYRFGLVQAAEWLAQRLRSEHGAAVSVTACQEPERLSEAAEVLLFRCLQDLVAACLEAQPQAPVQIACGYQMDEVRLQVTAPRTANWLGVGWATWYAGTAAWGIRSRLAYLGGNVSAVESVTHGTTITIAVPRPGRGAEETDGDAD